MPAPYEQDIRGIDFRAHPEKYRARESSEKIYEFFEAYKAQGDFVGADMARKFLQMGWTRARRYANHKSGHKYDGPVPLDKRGQSGAWGRDVLPSDPGPVKAESAAIFREKWQRAKDDPEYRRLMKCHREQHETR